MTITQHIILVRQCENCSTIYIGQTVWQSLNSLSLSDNVTINQQFVLVRQYVNHSTVNIRQTIWQSLNSLYLSGTLFNSLYSKCYNHSTVYIFQTMWQTHNRVYWSENVTISQHLIFVRQYNTHSKRKAGNRNFQIINPTIMLCP